MAESLLCCAARAAYERFTDALDLQHMTPLEEQLEVIACFQKSTNVSHLLRSRARP